MTNRPALLLDVDGVLNSGKRPRPDAGFRRHHVHVTALAVIEFPLGRVDPWQGGPHIWQLPAVEQAMAGRRFACIDDDFDPGDDDLDWAAERTAAGLPTLLVSCPPRTGLAQEHLEAVRAWTAGLPAPEPA